MSQIRIEKVYIHILKTSEINCEICHLLRKKQCTLMWWGEEKSRTRLEGGYSRTKKSKINIKFNDER